MMSYDVICHHGPVSIHSVAMCHVAVHSHRCWTHQRRNPPDQLGQVWTVDPTAPFAFSEIRPWAHWKLHGFDKKALYE